jgi:hypothetical protein
MLTPAMMWGGGTPKLVSIIGKGLLAYTNDLKNWVQVDVSGSADTTGKGIAYNSTNDVLMIAVQGSTFAAQVRKTKLASFKAKSSYSSTNGGTYNPTAGKLTYDAGKWMYGDVTSKVAMSADNGVTWTDFNTWNSSATRNASIIRYFQSAGIYVACYPNVASIGTSPSGSFNSAYWSVTGTPFTTQTRYVAEGSTSNFLALGGSSTVGQIATSTNLTTWTSRTWVNTNLPNWAAWNGSLWVVVANGGTIATSTDGISWTSRTSGIVTNLLWVDWDVKKNQFIVVGDSMVILTSSDGINWTNRNTVTTNFSSTTIPLQITRVS